MANLRIDRILLDSSYIYIYIYGEEKIYVPL